MRFLALAALLSPLAAWAQVRADYEGEQNALVLMFAIGGGLALFHVRRAYARSPAHGHRALVVVVALGLLLALFPPARALLALVAAVFLVYGFFRSA